jgi:hypothetical protein
MFISSCLEETCEAEIQVERVVFRLSGPETRKQTKRFFPFLNHEGNVEMKQLSGLWHRVAHERTDVSEEYVASIFKVENMALAVG